MLRTHLCVTQDLPCKSLAHYELESINNRICCQWHIAYLIDDQLALTKEQHLDSLMHLLQVVYFQDEEVCE